MAFAVSGSTQSIIVANTQFSQIVAQTICRRVTIGEDPAVTGWPTSDFLIAKPGPGNTPRRVQAGAEYEFVAQVAYQPGDVVGYVELASVGSTTFFQDESNT